MELCLHCHKLLDNLFVINWVILTLLYSGSKIGKSNDDSGGGVGSNELYKRRAKPMLDSSSDLYLLLDSILVSVMNLRP